METFLFADGRYPRHRLCSVTNESWQGMYIYSSRYVYDLAVRTVWGEGGVPYVGSVFKITEDPEDLFLELTKHSADTEF